MRDYGGEVTVLAGEQVAGRLGCPPNVPEEPLASPVFELVDPASGYCLAVRRRILTAYAVMLIIDTEFDPAAVEFGDRSVSTVRIEEESAMRGVDNAIGDEAKPLREVAFAGLSDDLRLEGLVVVRHARYRGNRDSFLLLPRGIVAPGVRLSRGFLKIQKGLKD